MIPFTGNMLLLKWMKPTVFRDKFGDIKECFWNMSSLSLHRVNMHCKILNHVPMRSFNKKCRTEKVMTLILFDQQIA